MRFWHVTLGRAYWRVVHCLCYYYYNNYSYCLTVRVPVGAAALPSKHGADTAIWCRGGDPRAPN